MNKLLPSLTEHEIQNQIIEFLQRQGYLVWRNNVGAQKFSYQGRDRWVRFGEKGHSDIFAVAPGGKFIAIEVKRDEKHKATAEQQAFLAKVRSWGGIGLVAWSVDMVAETLGIKGLL